VSPDVSICVATHRRPRGLARLLASLDALETPAGVTTEIVVVDNDAAGRARLDASQHGRLPTAVSWCVEPEPNIAGARNRAVREARGEWVAFVDDDEVVEPGWLRAFWSRHREHPDADGWFGPVLPSRERGGPGWLPAELFAAPRRRPSGTPLGLFETYTGNALVRRSWLLRHPFDPSYGRSGGSDVEAFARMLDAGARFAWCAEAVAHETVPRARPRLGWLARRAFRGGAVFTRVQRARDPRRAARAGLPRALLALPALALLLPFSLLLGRAACTRTALRLCVQAGHLWAFAGLSQQAYGAVSPAASAPPPARS
jgi:succinoglycan biosynthesis protein ExoM